LYNEKERLADLTLEDKNITAKIYIYILKDQTIDWDWFNIYKDIYNLTIAAEDIHIVQEAIDRGYKSFWSYPVYSYWELRSILRYGVSEVVIEAPLYFDLPKVKEICGDTEIRIVVNQCVNTILPLEHPECGTYVRPEDIDVYAQYVDHFEFISNSLEKERTLF